MTAPVTSRPALTEGLHRLLQRPITATDRKRAALHVLDWLGCALAGSVTVAGRALEAGSRIGGTGPCVLLGSGPRGSAIDAAFANGGLGNILEMDDIHRTSILHPGPIVIPAALAAAETFGCEATAFLDAVIRGYETTIRIGRAAGTPHYAHFHATATCGTFGAAAATASLLGLDAAGFVAGLGNAGATAGGLWRCRREPVMTKQWHNGIAAQNGMRAALAAQGGLTGSRYVLEGEDGFFQTLAGGGFDPGLVLSGDSEPWLIHETSFKPWPSCRHTHPALDAALLAHDAGVRADEVAMIQVETYGDAIRFCDRADPTTETEAKFSLQHVAALCLIKGRPRLADFLPEALADPGLTALRAKVRVARSDRMDQAYPQHYGASMTIALGSGESRTFLVRDALGDPENPISDDLLRAKAQSLLAAAGRDVGTQAILITRTLALAEGGALAAFTAALSTSES